MKDDTFHHVILTAEQLVHLRTLVSHHLLKLLTMDGTVAPTPGEPLPSQLIATFAKILNEVDLAKVRDEPPAALVALMRTP